MALDDLQESKVTREYLVYALRQVGLQKAISGTAQPQITRQGLTAISIPLPPLNQQQRIAAILDKADTLRAKRRAALAQLANFMQSIFIELFGDPIVNSKRFPVSNMGDVCDVRDGTHDSPKYVSDGGYPLVTSKNLSAGFLDLTDVNYISKEDYAQINKRSKVDRGDIIMPMIGTIGSPVLVEEEPHYAIKNVALIKFTAISPNAIFVRHLLSCHYFDYVVGQKNRGGTQKFVSLGDLRSFPLPMPSVSLQNEFALRVAAVDKLKAAHRASLVKIDALFASLQHRAFRGEL
jgi:type I restriction enzyme, S subunit